MSFSTDISTPGDNGAKSACYGQQLALAVPANIRCLKEYVTGLNPHGEKYEHLLPLTSFESNSKDYKRYCINALFLADVHLAIKLVYKYLSLMTKGLFLKRSEILGATTSFVSSQR